MNDQQPSSRSADDHPESAFDSTGHVDVHDGDPRDVVQSDLRHDDEHGRYEHSPSSDDPGSADTPPAEQHQRATDVPDDGQLHIVEDIEAYASTDPLPMDGQGAPVERQSHGDDAVELGSAESDSEYVAVSGAESSIEDVRDGGYGVGSAAPIEDGRQPLGHPIKAWEDTMTFVRPGESGYDEGQPHVWFYDEQAAQRAGFRQAHL